MYVTRFSGIARDESSSGHGWGGGVVCDCISSSTGHRVDSVNSNVSKFNHIPVNGFSIYWSVRTILVSPSWNEPTCSAFYSSSPTPNKLNNDPISPVSIFIISSSNWSKTSYTLFAYPSNKFSCYCASSGVRIPKPVLTADASFFAPGKMIHLLALAMSPACSLSGVVIIPKTKFNMFLL